MQAAVLGPAPPTKRLKSAVFAVIVAAATGAVAMGAAATVAKATGLAAMRAAATGAAVLGPAPPTKRLKSAVFLEPPEKIRGIEERNEELSFQFEDGELQREDEKREEQREEEEDVEEQREEDEKLAQRPLQPSLPRQKGFTCSCCLSRNHFTAYPFCVCCDYKVFLFVNHSCVIL
jgi:hypothetical protein